ncbi:probable inactive protein kinase DDB_G0270444 isoform X4 [Halyomorpha halys]|uniref:probable inactive protein kinase DDB_G0270444 isoform X4 n=1 Tax=Halyomorpha halys TaxID=286706 RepID=UPI0034D31C44
MDGTGVNSLGISIKEEVTDETEPNGISNLDISIKEETNETDQSNLYTIQTNNIKEEEKLDIYDDTKHSLNETDQLKEKTDLNIPVMCHHTDEKGYQCPHCEYNSVYLGLNNLGISIKEEVLDETEPNGITSLEISINEVSDNVEINDMTSFGISIKEEVTDETELNGVCNLDMSNKEEMTTGTDQSTVPTVDIKEEEVDIHYDGLVHVKQEEELHVPDNARGGMRCSDSPLLCCPNGRYCCGKRKCCRFFNEDISARAKYCNHP